MTTSLNNLNRSRRKKKKERRQKKKEERRKNMDDQRRRVAVAVGGAMLAIGEVEMEQQMVIAREAQRRQHEEEEERRLARLARGPRIWVRDWIGRRQQFGWYEQLMAELEREDPRTFKNMVRMEPAMFHELVDRLTPRIAKRDTNYRKALPPGLKVAITLKYLATGDKYKTMSQGFRVADNSVSICIKEVCQAIIDELKEEVLVCPTTPEEWLEVAEGFKRKWNFLHALGALDGKHIRSKQPPKSGTTYRNYKKFFSIILMALVDSEYKFMWVEVGANGASSDAQIFNASELKRHIEAENLGIPLPEPLEGDDQDMPYFLIGDDAFALREYMMKPYPRTNLDHDKRIFNYRCSRARRVVENAFGILANRFQCLLGTLGQKVTTMQKIVMACVCLHNLMRIRYPGAQIAVADREDDEHNLIPGAWRDGRALPDIARALPGNHDTLAAKNQRDYLKAYYNSPVGAVPWQERMI